MFKQLVSYNGVRDAVSIYVNNGQYVCGGCLLSGKRFFKTPEKDSILRHMEDHRTANYGVSDRAFRVVREHVME